MKYRDRIVELRRIRAGDLMPAPLNWRKHPEHQAQAMRGVLAEIGYADAVLARETPDGLELIDGHLRAGLDDEQIVPVLVLDLDADEAKQLLVTLDPLAAMAETDTEALAALLTDVTFNDESITAMLAALVNGQQELEITIPDGLSNQEQPDSLVVVTLRMDDDTWESLKSTILGFQQKGVIVDAN